MHNLKATKARSHFIQSAHLNLKIYKYEPTNFLELVRGDEKPNYPKEFDEYKHFKDKELERLNYEKWLATERENKTKRHMAGSLALTFLFKDQDLHEIIKFKKDSSGKQAAAEEDEPNQKLERRKSAKGAELDVNIEKMTSMKPEKDLISKE